MLETVTGNGMTVMGSAGKDRQAKFKTAQREAGRRQITVWANETQAISIRSLLAGNAPATPSQADLDDLAARENAVKFREEIVARHNKIHGSLQSIDEAERRLKSAQADLQERQAAFDREQLALAKKEARGKISFANRRAKLVEIHTTKKMFASGDREKIDTSWSANEAAKEMSDLSRKTNIAGNTVKELLAQFGKNELLTEREHAALELAGKVLSELASAAGDAKDMVRATAKDVKAAEEARSAAAHAAAKKEFEDLTLADSIVILAGTNNAYRIQSLRDDLREGRNIHSSVDDAQRNAFAELKYKIEALIKSGSTPNDAAKTIRARFEAGKAALLEEHTYLITKLTSALVAARLEAAAKNKSSG